MGSWLGRPVIAVGNWFLFPIPELGDIKVSSPIEISGTHVAWKICQHILIFESSSPTISEVTKYSFNSCEFKSGYNVYLLIR